MFLEHLTQRMLYAVFNIDLANVPVRPTAHRIIVPRDSTPLGVVHGDRSKGESDYVYTFICPGDPRQTLDVYYITLVGPGKLFPWTRDADDFECVIVGVEHSSSPALHAAVRMPLDAEKNVLFERELIGAGYEIVEGRHASL